MKVLETERLILRRLAFDDAAFILELVNEPQSRSTERWKNAGWRNKLLLEN